MRSALPCPHYPKQARSGPVSGLRVRSSIVSYWTSLPGYAAKWEIFCADLCFNFLIRPAFALRLALGEMSTVLLSSQRVVSKKLENTGFVFRYSDIKSAVEQTVRNR